MGGKRCSLLRREAANVDAMRDRGLRCAIPAHLIEPMPTHEANQDQDARETTDQLTRHRRFNHPDTSQLGRPCANLVHPDVITMTVAALLVVADQQVRPLVRQQRSQPAGRFLDVRTREPGPARRVLE